ncbi:MAG: LPS export ABC transporter periplasmic protein LptC [Epsilonproteobacteria bacterium]|nr:LPS export ABC transporter periplasmic protein LptC [Campylobacterota bacterium]
MNINLFFILIFIGLGSIFLFFKPLEVKQESFEDVPLFELSHFTLYELNREKLSTVMHGDKAIRFDNRYRVDGINYTDNSEYYVANMRSNLGIYKDDIVDLKGDVTYTREDGLTFETQHATYDKIKGIASTNVRFLAYRGSDRVEGAGLLYENKENKARAKGVSAVYNLITEEQ